MYMDDIKMFVKNEKELETDHGVLYYRPLHSAHKSLDWRPVFLAKIKFGHFRFSLS